MYNIMGFPLLLAKAGVWYEIPNKGDAASFDNTPKEVKDLVRISVKAKACGRGDVVWLCWQPCGANDTPQRVDRISSGTMLVLVTPAGARMLKTLLDGTSSHGSIPRNHFDVGLKEWCSKEDNAARLKMCYLVPPLGNYTTHQSGCDPTFAKGAGRPSCWNCDWVCRGTREDEDEKKREKWLCSPRKKGQPLYLKRCRITDNVAEWTSYWAGDGEPPQFRPANERKPMKKKPAADSSREADAGIEPTAIQHSSKGKNPPPPPPPPPPRHKKGGKPTDSAHPWPDAGPPADDPIEEDDDLPVETQKKTKRNSRWARQCILYRTMRNWIDEMSKARIYMCCKIQLLEWTHAAMGQLQCMLGAT